MVDSSKTVFKPDSDIHITFEDQQKINVFAKYNAKYEELKSEIKAKENELKSYDDAEDELELRDESDGNVPFLIGDNFFHMDSDKAKESIKAIRERGRQDIKKMKDSMDDLKDNMGTLKTQLYAKFGSHINLEGEE